MGNHKKQELMVEGNSNNWHLYFAPSILNMVDKTSYTTPWGDYYYHHWCIFLKKLSLREIK
jgi:hypothetical protein